MKSRHVDPWKPTTTREEVAGWDLESDPVAKECLHRSLMLDLVLMGLFTGFFLLKMIGA